VVVGRSVTPTVGTPVAVVGVGVGPLVGGRLLMGAVLGAGLAAGGDVTGDDELGEGDLVEIGRVTVAEGCEDGLSVHGGCVVGDGVAGARVGFPGRAVGRCVGRSVKGVAALGDDDG
jgi:hypothetical protein